jgi:hypothetical protein
MASDDEAAAPVEAEMSTTEADGSAQQHRTGTAPAFGQSFKAKKSSSILLDEIPEPAFNQLSRTAAAAAKAKPNDDESNSTAVEVVDGDAATDDAAPHKSTVFREPTKKVENPFMTGMDITTPEATALAAKRSERFGLTEVHNPLAASMGITSAELAAREARLDKFAGGVSR